MAFCTKCGAEIAEGQHCANCSAQNNQKANTQFDINSVIDKVVNTADTTAEYDAADIANNKVWAILSYIFILFLLPLFIAKDSKFAHFHASQGLNLCILSVLSGIVCAILACIPIIGWLLSVIIGLIPTALMVLGIVNAAMGKAKELPFIGSFRII
ncbi:MAG: DUF4870 domain-containing protein [Clostridia bacterium]|nr:DUF4870 domain-containing protein [Clostridia bacterium]